MTTSAGVGQVWASRAPARVRAGVDTDPVDHGVRPKEVEVFKDASGLGPGGAAAGEAAHPVFVKDQDLFWGHVPDQAGPAAGRAQLSEAMT